MRQTETARQPKRQPQRLSESFQDFLNPRALRRIADIELERNRERAERRAEHFQRTERRLEVQRRRDNRTEANTSTTGQPFFFWGRPAQSNPEATDGRRLRWEGHGRQRAEADEPTTADDDAPQTKPRPPTTSTAERRKANRTAPKERPNAKKKADRERSGQGRTKKQGRNKKKQTQTQKQKRRTQRQRHGNKRTKSGEQSHAEPQATGSSGRNTVTNSGKRH